MINIKLIMNFDESIIVEHIEDIDIAIRLWLVLALMIFWCLL